MESAISGQPTDAVLHNSTLLLNGATSTNSQRMAIDYGPVMQHYFTTFEYHSIDIRTCFTANA
jgi:hypothetical protein